MKQEVISYLFFGVLTTLINFISYLLLTDVLGVLYTAATVVSWIVAVLFAYITNKIYVFKTQGNILKELGSFIVFRLLSLGLDLGLMIVMVSMLQINDLFSKVVVNILVVIINYLLSKFMIFQRKEPSHLGESHE
ncbi:GtrA family protein [Fictibacillus nanhaiensis]|uniref:GtrA family protein n=1 Tax=Fictibacillus nanhaiensis TaxID=742169 RepID=A0ABS2ZMB4_9BACL|nr:GtrA family protein [Fictibacillus nanhaiensis]